MFLHAIGTSSWMWAPLFGRLPGFSCLAPDLPGHGESRDIAWASIEDTADRIADIIRAQVETGRAHIVGLSMGSYVGLTLMARHPEVVDHAVLSGLNIMPLPGKVIMAVMAWVMAPLLKTRFGAQMNAKALNIPTADFEGYREGLRQLSLRSFVTASGDATNYETPANLAKVTTPTLVVAGEREHELVHQSMQKLVDLLPHAKGATAPGLGHGWSAEDPELFAATVAAWCDHQQLSPGITPITKELVQP
ncbi:MAG: alpha/beta fold hydrolase [Devosia sp.]